MKKISKTIQIDAYTDDDGKPVCGACDFRIIRRSDKWCVLECDISGGPDDDCPIWRKQDDTGSEEDQP